MERMERARMEQMEPTLSGPNGVNRNGREWGKWRGRNGGGFERMEPPLSAGFRVNGAATIDRISGEWRERYRQGFEQMEEPLSRGFGVNGPATKCLERGKWAAHYRVSFTSVKPVDNSGSSDSNYRTPAG